jgi:prefoldin subunit 2
VIKTLEQKEGSKRAWRLVGDVLVERTVEEVLPEVQKNRDNLLAISQNIKKQLDSKQKEVLAFQEKYNIRIKRQSERGGPPQQRSEGDSGAKASVQGVLVTDK